MTRAPLIFLPPSEGKKQGGVRAVGTVVFQSELAGARAGVVRALQALVEGGTREQMAMVFAARNVLLDRAVETCGNLVDGVAPLLPAWERYNGVVWRALEPSTLSATARRRILIPSGLYGITTGEDLVADYRLKMGARLAPLGALSSFWRPQLSTVLADALRGRVVVDLLPREHEAAIDRDALRATCRVIQVRFVDVVGARAVGHAAKSVKGVLARQVLVGGVGALRGFAHEGWRTRGSKDRVDVVFDAA